MLSKLKRILFSCLRWGQSHGFGVQSPFAYRFIRDVVRETYPYYAYDSLYKKYSDQDADRLRLLRFYLRLSNYLQAKRLVSNNQKTETLDYFRAGCKDTVLSSRDKNPDVSILSIVDDNTSYYERYLESLLNVMSERSVLIVEDIHSNKLAYSLWGKVVSDSRVGITFDIYDCGVAFFNLNLPKSSYKVMLK